MRSRYIGFTPRPAYSVRNYEYARNQIEFRTTVNGKLIGAPVTVNWVLRPTVDEKMRDRKWDKAVDPTIRVHRRSRLRLLRSSVVRVPTTTPICLINGAAWSAHCLVGKVVEQTSAHSSSGRSNSVATTVHCVCRRTVVTTEDESCHRSWSRLATCGILSSDVTVYRLQRAPAAAAGQPASEQSV